MFASAAWGQYGGLATPFDGSVVYFASGLTLKGTSEPTWGKLFAADRNGVRLIRSLPQAIPAAPGPGYSCILGTYYSFGAAETTADGTNILAPGNISFANNCEDFNTWATYWISPSGDRQLADIIRISPNGRYAIADTTGGPLSVASVSYADPATGSLTRIDLPSGIYLGGIRFGTGRTIANNGTAIFNIPFESAFTVSPGADPQPFTPGLPYAIDASGTYVLYGADTLRMFNLQTRQDNLVMANFSPTWQFGPGMSDDGQRVLTPRGGQVWVVGGDGSGARQLSSDPAGIADAILSGNGKVVYAVTQAGRLLQIDADTGDQIELVGRTPHFSLDPGSQLLTPGTPGTVYLDGLPDVSMGAPSLPGLSLADTTITIGGQAVPVLFVMPDHIDFLTPWNLGAGTGPVELPLVAGVAGDRTPFDFPQTPVWIAACPQVGAVAHQDWSGPVTSSSPPHAGEILHFFMAGLGAAVNPEVPLGTPAPSAEPLARLATPMTCTGQQVLYAGLAPGETWRVYQVDLKLGSQTGQVWFDCSWMAAKLRSPCRTSTWRPEAASYGMRCTRSSSARRGGSTGSSAA